MAPPPPRLIRTPDDAELAAADWLRYFGYVDVDAFPGAGPDGGIDLRGRGLVGQVKAEARPTGRPVIQQTYGIAMAEGSLAVVFSLGGFTDEALDWADDVGVALFTFDLTGEPIPSNAAARGIVSAGEPSGNWKPAIGARSRARLERLAHRIEDAQDRLGELWDETKMVEFRTEAVALLDPTNSERYRAEFEKVAADLVRAQAALGPLGDELDAELKALAEMGIAEDREEIVAILRRVTENAQDLNARMGRAEGGVARITWDPKSIGR